MPNAIDDSTRREDKYINIVRLHSLEQDDKCGNIILVILERLCDGLSHSFESGKMDDCRNLAPCRRILRLRARLSSLRRIHCIVKHRVSLVRGDLTDAHRKDSPLGTDLVRLPEVENLVH